MSRLRVVLLTAAVLLGAGDLIWQWLAYVQYRVSPPWPISAVFTLVFFGLIFSTIAISRRIEAHRTRELHHV
jgi:hypothetical protein